MPSKDFSLLVSIPGEDPARHDLSGDSITIGRGPDNGIQVLVSEVSVQHGAFEATGESYKIVDNGSTNGTKVNGTAVSGDGIELSPMDRILLGDTIPAYFVPSAVLEATPAAELIASIEEKAKDTPQAAAAPAQPVQPARPAVALPAQTPASGAATVRLDQVKPGAPGPVKPAPAGPAAPKLPTPPKPGGAPPAPPAPAAPGSAPPAAPTPGAPKPVAPVPLKKPGGPAAPSIPLPKTPPKPGE